MAADLVVMGNRSYVRCEPPDMESCRSVFLAKLYSVMARRCRCVVASGPDRFAPVRAAHIGLPFAEKINKLDERGLGVASGYS